LCFYAQTHFDDDNRNGLGNNNDPDGHALCEQDDQNWRYEFSHAHSRPAGDDVDVERGTDVESGDESGSDKRTGRLYLTLQLRLRQLHADGELDRQIQLEPEKRETIKMKFTLQRQAEREKIETQLQADRERNAHS